MSGYVLCCVYYLDVHDVCVFVCACGQILQMASWWVPLHIDCTSINVFAR